MACDVKIVGRRAKNEPRFRVVFQTRLVFGPEKGVGLAQLDTIQQPEQLKILTQQRGGGQMQFDHRGRNRAATEGFDGQRARATEKIDDMPAFHRRANQIEHGLTHSILHGPDPVVADVLKPTATQTPPDDSQADRLFLARRAADVFFLF